VRKPSRLGRDPALGIETESAEPPPQHARRGGLAARCVNDKAPVTFDEGLELPDRNGFKGQIPTRQAGFWLPFSG
jgi:hypothetical protein